jgi:hypothetical protein
MKEVRLPILPHYAGDYRLEYDGKYITLFGADNRYKGFNMNKNDDVWYEEMVLVPCVIEARNARPKIKEVTETEIVINY